MQIVSKICTGLPEKNLFFTITLRNKLNQNKTSQRTKRNKTNKKRDKTLQVLIKLFQSIKNTLLNEISMHKQHVHFSYLSI